MEKLRFYRREGRSTPPVTRATRAPVHEPQLDHLYPDPIENQPCRQSSDHCQGPGA
jgi:hypothetical protein